jgi:hypothetical protein
VEEYVSLRLIAQEDNISMPEYKTGDVVEGTVEIAKTDGISSVEVKVGCCFSLLVYWSYFSKQLCGFRLKAVCVYTK